MGNIVLQRSFSRSSSVFCVVCCLVLMASAFVVPLPTALAEGGPFADFAGLWSGAGTLRPENGAAEQIRCNANYSQRGSSQREVNLQLRCASDSYNFDMAGEVFADETKPKNGRRAGHTRHPSGADPGETQGGRPLTLIEKTGLCFGP